MAIGILRWRIQLVPGLCDPSAYAHAPGLMIAAEERKAKSTEEAGVTRCRC
jgi:hypothetical protein